jgi:hypothetical protein
MNYFGDTLTDPMRLVRIELKNFPHIPRDLPGHCYRTACPKPTQGYIRLFQIPQAITHTMSHNPAFEKIKHSDLEK